MGIEITKVNNKSQNVESGENKASLSSKKSLTFERIQTILKFAPGFFVLGYAYLYFIGYIYVASYFGNWGLSPIDLGFNIIEYATISMFPFFFLFSLILIGFPIGVSFSIGVLKDFTIKFLKLPKAFHTLIVILAPVIYVTVGFINFKSLFLGYSPIIVMPAISFIIGATYKPEIGVKENFKKTYSFLIIIFLIFIPLFSSILGKSYAMIYNNYSPIVLYDGNLLNKIHVYSDTPIDGLDFFQSGTFVYKGLRLLIFRNNVYYFIPDIHQLDFFSTKLDKVGAEMDKMFSEYQEVQYQMESQQGQIKDLFKNTDLDKLEEELHNVKNFDDLIILKKRKIEILKKQVRIHADIFNEYEMLNPKITSLIEKSTNLLEKLENKTKEYGNFVSYFSELFSKVFIIRKELVNNIELIYE